MIELLMLIATALTNFCEPVLTTYESADSFVFEETHTLYTINNYVCATMQHSVECVPELDFYHIITDDEAYVQDSNAYDISHDVESTSKYLLEYISDNYDEAVITRNDSVQSLYIHNTERFPIKPSLPDAESYLLQFIGSDNRITLVYEITYSTDSNIAREYYRYTTSFDTVNLITVLSELLLPQFTY